MQHAKEILKLLLEKANIDVNSPQVSLFNAWDSIIGSDLSGSIKIIDINLGKLIIEVDHPARMQLVHMRQSKIISIIKKRFPSLGINRIHLLVKGQIEK